MIKQVFFLPNLFQSTLNFYSKLYMYARKRENKMSGLFSYIMVIFLSGPLQSRLYKISNYIFYCYVMM